MFGRTPKDEDRQALEPVMNRILAEMEMFGPDSPEYPKLMNSLEQIVNLRSTKVKHGVTPDTWVMVGGNLAGIIAIISYERVHVMTTKAFGLLRK